MNKPYYLTTSILYPNAKPHMGHALELVQADFLARYKRLHGESVRFQTGLDEHGLKIQRTAEAANLSPRAFVDQQKEHFTGLIEQLEVVPDQFIRTTDTKHAEVAQAFWRRCLATGDIYKKTYRAWYNIKEEEFLGSADDVKDPSVFGIEERFIELIEEENYFFRLSKYQDEVKRLIEEDVYKITPKNRKNEVLNFVMNKGLQDISISREASKLPWGIPVPEDPSQVMYVWFDALTNYLTGACSIDGQGIITTDLEWPTDLHIVGKDIARFHAAMWPAMLLSAGLEIPKNLLVHGFILGEGGRKMSKSLGNGVDPIDMLKVYGSSTLRWYFLKEIPTTEDGIFTEDRLKEIYASDLANDFGNLVSRVLTMTQKYAEGKVPDVNLEGLGNVEQMIVQQKWEEYHTHLTSFEIDKALEAAHSLVVFSNKRIEEMKPWAMAKDENEHAALQELLYELLEIIRHITLMYQPAMPSIAEIIQSKVFTAEIENPFTWGGLQPGQTLNAEPLILFPRLA